MRGNQEMMLERQTEVRSLRDSNFRRALCPLPCEEGMGTEAGSRNQGLGCDWELSD